jgi:hypothetical protein
MAKSKNDEQAEKFLSLASRYGFVVDASHTNVLRISKSFRPGDSDAFTGADMLGPAVLDEAPLRGGSVWGTDGGSIGGMVGMQNGRYVLNKSGDGANFMKALRKTIARSR